MSFSTLYSAKTYLFLMNNRLGEAFFYFVIDIFLEGIWLTFLQLGAYISFLCAIFICCDFFIFDSSIGEFREFRVKSQSPA
ncbi:hypothetical protein A4R63_06805 [Corynebacterium pseudotuberculosis]|nr:hypothetical protein ATN03_06825 [Corynebacterium pseudotuberculosis]AMN73556.1 hypothetical protein ATN04_03795 [Corynebacterium pseudotuberculosis]AMN76280.1 hypothetical protein ATN05_08335 [Corynebacterium pseudotuberculosis]ANZ92393.1 hypothetical protein CPMB20_08350 [Corynebacterium pseudotuberculosis]APB11207.1 hypothetical protein A4R72_07035 [Corynebacterium pseudotuberculosis]